MVVHKVRGNPSQLNDSSDVRDTQECQHHKAGSSFSTVTLGRQRQCTDYVILLRDIRPVKVLHNIVSERSYVLSGENMAEFWEWAAQR